MYSIGIITASDKGSRGEREDLSGKAIAETLAELGEVKQYVIVPDEREVLSQAMINMADNVKIDIILTTGGTGLGPRDVTPEATLAVIDRQVPGIPEVMRAKSLEKTSRAMLSRAVAGLRGRTLIINLPGSPKGVRECLEVILPALDHGLAIMKGEAGECARP
ncbi:Molybdopterin adenylyltransferase [Sporomusa ovata DSM 2662]|uniref:Molybdenum cofactor biosynthesis protein B n=1 Tax=Sporomusa ovata TaxID=2378 RepID=A0A0U1L516_9FIRM|nr:molybdenum cofactor synthesis domain-containing protein [Sporomusa ovata]EQB25664.1 molybdopterin adenylyltransferase [Sporomusa ovata DSM 2662]CQR74223.1 Molybdenum cofactor biosynthesis protein MoaB [Sporomusa ovata]